jgi:hypothetical protein
MLEFPFAINVDFHRPYIVEIVIQVNILKVQLPKYFLFFHILINYQDVVLLMD